MHGTYYFKSQVFLAFFFSLIALAPLSAEKEEAKAEPAAEVEKKSDKKAEKKEEAKAEDQEAVDAEETENEDDAVTEEGEEVVAAVARPVSPDPIQVYGWREKIQIDGVEKGMNAKLDTGADTGAIHSEETELFERDGKKWVRFVVTDPRKKDFPRIRLEAPLVRVTRIKGESEAREVVRLAFKIGERKLRGDFTLSDRSRYTTPILIGRTTIKELGWIDSSRTNLADEKIMR